MPKPRIARKCGVGAIGIDFPRHSMPRRYSPTVSEKVGFASRQTMLELKQGATYKVVPFLLVSSANHVDGATGLTPAVEISKNGGAFAAPVEFVHLYFA